MSKKKIPIYVTRPAGPKGRQGVLALPSFSQITALYITLANIIGWGIYGLVELVGKVV